MNWRSFNTYAALPVLAVIAFTSYSIIQQLRANQQAIALWIGLTSFAIHVTQHFPNATSIQTRDEYGSLMNLTHQDITKSMQRYGCRAPTTKKEMREGDLTVCYTLEHLWVILADRIEIEERLLPPKGEESDDETARREDKESYDIKQRDLEKSKEKVVARWKLY
ncbi:hypothetical protein ACLMJK_004705 [Lecanora helva]